MAIIKAPLASDPPGKCSRWRVVLYVKGKQEWTTHLSRGAAQEYERAQKSKLRAGTHIARTDKVTVAQLYDRFMADRLARGKRTSTIAWYTTIAKKYLLAPEHGLAEREAGSVRPDDFGRMFERMLAAGASTSSVNRVIVMGRALWRFAIKRRLAEQHPLIGFERYAMNAKNPSRAVRRGAYSETELKAIFDAARPHELALVALLALTGARPGEVFALRCCDLDLVGGTATIARSWDWRGKVFTEPKTAAGKRAVPLGGWLVERLREHVEREALQGDALLFATRQGHPYNPSNCRRDIWSKLVKRAGVRALDMYSLRHTYATFARSAGQAAYNVSRVLGHSRSTLVDDVYGHGNSAAMTAVALAVEGRLFGSKLRVIEGGVAPRDVRQTLEESSATQTNAKASA